MGSKRKSKKPSSNSSTTASSTHVGGSSSFSGLRHKHQQELESLTLITQPLRTIKFFNLAIALYCKRLVHYLLSRGGLLLVLSTLLVGLGVFVATTQGTHGKHIQELLQYGQFVLWWIGLGVASSIGLGSGLHTFVLYLGPHIALFTIKAMQCGRVDLKSAPYDTIQLNHGPSWLDKDCSEFGPPLFESLNGLNVPLSSILPQVQLEAMLWGLGTALGELPPYFISRAASLAGSEVDPMEELSVPLVENSWSLNALFNRSKLWFISHAQYLNFLTVLLLASVPNPLFDLAGILCGQFGVPFWEFFFATLIGKALVKTHIQTVIIISICNNQLLHWVENELIWALSSIPGISSALPSMIAKLHAVKDKYLIATPPGPPDTKAKKWRLSFSSIWNTVVWLVLVNFFFKIVNSIAQGFLKKQQEEELVVASKKKKPLSTY